MGKLILRGRHRVFCGDSGSKEDMATLMGGVKAPLVFTDPPYNHAGKDALVAAGCSPGMQALKDSEWDKGFVAKDFLNALDTVLAPDCSIYICTSWHLAGEIWEFYSTRSTTRGYCVWSKPNPMPSLMKRHWTWSSELICYATRGKHIFNFPGEGHAPNVWTFNKSQKNDLHPTMKPVAIPEHAIIHSSDREQVVIDAFMGSGSTLIAAEKTGRKCYGMEINPLYVDVILDRWTGFTGRKVVRKDGTAWEACKDT